MGQKNLRSFSAPDVPPAGADIFRTIVFLIPAAGKRQWTGSLLDT